MHCTTMLVSLKFFLFQTSLQMVHSTSQSELFCGCDRIHDHHADPAGSEPPAPHQTKRVNGLWPTAALLWSLLRGGVPRLRRGLLRHYGSTYRGRSEVQLYLSIRCHLTSVLQ